MPEINIKHDGRKVISRDDVPSVKGMVTTIKYDDGTYVECTDNSFGEITVRSNKTFHVEADGETIRLKD